MKNSPLQLLSSAIVLASLLLGGCSKPSDQALTPDKVPAAMNQAFGQTSGQARDVALQAVAAFQQNNPVAAFNSLQSLVDAPGLTREQRSTAVHAMVTAIGQMRQAAEQGDQIAQQTLSHYAETK